MNLIREIDKEKYRKSYADLGAYVTVIKADPIAATDYGISPESAYDFFAWFDADSKFDVVGGALVKRIAERFFVSSECETIKGCEKLVSDNLIIVAAKERKDYLYADKVLRVGDTIDDDIVGFLVTYNDTLDDGTIAFEDMARDTYRNRTPCGRDVSLHVARKVVAAKSYEEKIKILADAYFTDWRSYNDVCLYTFAVFVNDEVFYVGTKQACQYYYYPEDALEAGMVYVEQKEPDIAEAMFEETLLAGSDEDEE